MIRFSQLPAITGGTILHTTDDLPVGPLLIDSRKLHLAPGSIFFALCGKHYDGHDFLQRVYDQGIRQFVVEKTGDYLHLPQANILHVTDGVATLQKLVAYHRQQFHLPLLAITGSNAKTIIKEWISQLMEQQYVVVKNPKSYNSQIGVPLSVWQINATHEYGIFEAGISLPDEMSRLEKILKPNRGLFTNIGPAHDQGFESRAQKIREKALLFQGCNKIYYCLDHTPIHEILTELYPKPGQLVSWSFHPQTPATYHIHRQPGAQVATMLLTVTAPHKKYRFVVPFRDHSSLENIAHCIILLLNEGFQARALQSGLRRLKSIPMRLSLKQGLNNCQVIDDTYNNDLAGLQVALDFMAQQKKSLKRTIILSDLLQTKIPVQELYAQVAQLLQEKKVYRLIGIGPAITAHAKAFDSLETQFYPHTEALLAVDLPSQFANELVLVKGARMFALEQVVKQLQQKIHSTVLEVDLDAIGHNLNFFRGQLNAKTKLMAMVKALAYGSSSYEIAQLLQHHGVDYLAVAYVDEGVALRMHGITLPIMVMNTTPESFDKLLTYQLEPEIYSIALLKDLQRFLADYTGQVNIHLMLETGMHRLGITEHEIDALLTLLKESKTTKVVGLMSHLAVSPDPDEDQYTHQQAALFQQMTNRIEQHLGINTTWHLLNSAGIVRFPQYQFGMVRLGIGLYGVGMPPAITQHLEVASTLKTIVSQVKNVPQGATIGYGRHGVAHRDTKLATIAIGYADGFRRAMGKGQGSVMIHEQLAPVIGEVCMDMAMIDVTDLPAVTVGDEVIIFGKDRPIAQVAEATHTIPYEILTNVSERVTRIYYTN